MLLRLGEALIQFGAGLGLQRGDADCLVLQQLVRVLGFLGLVECALAQAGVEGGVGEFLQQFAAFVVIGFEKGAELALGQHHGTGELFEVQAQACFELDLVIPFLAGQQLVAVQVTQALAAGLQFAGGLFAGAVGFPAGAVAAPVDADKVDFGIALTGATAQQGARVAGGNLAVSIRHLGIAAGVVQSWHGAKQGQAQGVEQGAFAGAGGAGDGEQASAGQGLGGKVQLEGAGQGGEVFQADGEDFHGCSPSCWTSCSSTAKSLRVCSSASLP